MDMNQTNTKSKEQWIKEVRERLDWYTFQASEGEFDAQEVEALVSLLTVLEPEAAVPTKEVKPNLEELKRYQEEKSADAEALAALYGEKERAGATIGAVASNESMSGKVMSADARRAGRILGGSHRFVKVAVAAAILAVLTVGGAVGVVNAGKGGDFVLWLRKNIQGEKVVLEPQVKNFIQTNQGVGNIYYDIEEVPEEYREYLVDFDGMKGLEGYELEQIEVSDYEGGWKMSSLLQAEEREVWLGVRAYQDYVAVQEKNFDGYGHAYSKEIDGTEFDLYQKPDNTDGEDALICFYHGGRQYFVYGNRSAEALEQLAAEYAKKIFEKF